MAENKKFNADEISKAVNERLKDYDDKSLLEKFALFMGKAQILEMALKGLLERKFEMPISKTEKWTLGQVKNKLKEKGLREDFIVYLESVIEHRNYIAHDYLAYIAITKSIANFSDRKVVGDLFRATYELEQIILFYDWTEEYGSWI